jgi:hypothetical protein
MVNPELFPVDTGNDIDLAVACDIRLGKLFRTMPELRDKYLDIDVSAIETILDSFEPETALPILFEATYDGTLLETMGGLRGNNVTVAIPGGLTTLSESPDKQRSTRVMVGVGGPMTTIAHNPTMLVARALEALPHLVDESGAPKSGGLSVEDKLAISKIVRETSSLMPAEELQQAVVHELRHAADFTRPSLEKQSKRYDQMTRIKGVVGMVAVYAAAELAVQIPFDIAHIESSLPRIAAMVAIGIATISKAEKYINRYRLKRELKSPHEKLAYATADTASSLPTVISFNDLPVRAE